jgi:hypothetical protein
LISFSRALASLAEARLTYSKELKLRAPSARTAVLLTATRREAKEICEATLLANILLFINF